MATPAPTPFKYADFGWSKWLKLFSIPAGTPGSPQHLCSDVGEIFAVSVNCQARELGMKTQSKPVERRETVRRQSQLIQQLG
jgi:hypothetical protein